MSVKYGIARLTCDKCGFNVETFGGESCYSDCAAWLTVPAGWTVAGKYYPELKVLSDDDLMPDAIDTAPADDDETFCPACNMNEIVVSPAEYEWLKADAKRRDEQRMRRNKAVEVRRKKKAHRKARKGA
jgi:hypothetical protein